MTERPQKPLTQMRNCSTLCKILVVFVIAAFSLLSQVKASAASLNVSPGTILSGATVNVSGSGFPANAPLVLWLDTNGNGQLDQDEPVFPVPITTDGSGAIPAINWSLIDVPAGSFLVQAGGCSAPAVALCTGTTGIAQGQLTITVGISRSRFGSGTTVAITGFAFSANAAVNVWYDQAANGTFPGQGSISPATDSNGAFSTSLVVNDSPGPAFIHVGSSTTPDSSLQVNIETCWFQECMVNDDDKICMLGNSPGALEFAGVDFSDCKTVDTNYTKPTPITQLNNPPGGYDLTNVGSQFLGAGVLAAASVDLGAPGTACVAMTSAIANAEIFYGNSVPDKVSLLAITCGTPLTPPVGLGPYLGAVHLSGHSVPDEGLISGAVLAIGGPAAPPPVQATMAQAAVAGAIACGFVNYFCNGSDITANMLLNPTNGGNPPDLQSQLIGFPFFQPPFDPIPQPPDPNKCFAVNGNCWAGLIGWGNVACKDVISSSGVDSNGNGSCETDPGPNNDFPSVPRAGSAGPDNVLAQVQCTTGTVVGLSIGYDGDVSFDVNGPDVLRLVNYHNFLPGPGGSEPPNGIDVEIPLVQRPIFMGAIQALRPGMTVHVCGYWVADMHMLWNELHPVTSLSILVPLTVTANNATQVYGADTPGFTVSYNGFLNGDTPAVLGGTLSCTTTATSASPVGNYPITCSGQTSSTYGITYQPGTLSVTQAPLTISVNNATREYGSGNPAFTFGANGLVNGDTVASIGIHPICSAAATAASPVGTYPIVCSGPSSTMNYAITYSPGTLTITQAPLTIVANNATRQYGSVNPVFTAIANGLLNGDTLASIGVSPSCSTSATTASPVGSYPITCTGPSSSLNYAISYQAGTLTITAAPLTITANDATKLLNAPNPSFSASYSGFVNGDSPASLSGTLICTTTAVTTSLIGSYPITCSGQSSNNYSITYVPGTLKIMYASGGICDGDAGHQILPPIRADGAMVGQQGRTVPAKFRVCDANGVSVGTPGVVTSFMLIEIIRGTVTDVNETVLSTTPDTAFRWDSGGQLWIFNISTSNLASGQTYVYAIQLNDGSTINFRFGLR